VLQIPRHRISGNVFGSHGPALRSQRPESLTINRDKLGPSLATEVSRSTKRRRSSFATA